MFSHGRACLKGRRVSTILDNIAAGPDEPLLFLYPRWLKSTVRHYRTSPSRPSASARVRHARRLILGGPRPPRKLLSGPILRRGKPPVATHTDGKAEAPTTTNTSDNGSSKVAGSLAALTEKTKNPRPFIGPIKPPFNPFLRWPEPPSRSPSFKRRSSKYKTQWPASRAEWYTLSAQDRAKLALQRNRFRRNPKEKRVAWRVIEATLKQLQKKSARWTKKELRHKELLVPEETVGLIAGVTNMGMKENIWFIPVHNGCKVHVLHPQDGDGRGRRVIISGSARVIELASERIEHARILQEQADPLVDLQKPPIPVISSRDTLISKGIDPPLVRGTWDIKRARPAMLHTITPLAASLSTVREFAEYVEELTLSKPSPSEEEKSPHRKQVNDALVAVFAVDAYKKLFSTAALNEALSWMCKHKYFRYIYPVLSRAQHVATVDTVNILLESAAQRQDPSTYHWLLKAMFRAKIRPNESTWITFLDHVAWPKERKKLSDRLLRRGYLRGIHARREALRLTLEQKFHTHLENGRSVDSFINELNAQTRDWTTGLSISLMFGVIQRRRDYMSLDRLLEICREENFPINSSSILHIMNMFGNDTFLALRYLYRCGPEPEMVFDGLMWERLFFMAWDDRRYNLTRVLWRYACLYGAVTFAMKKRVDAALMRRAILPEDNEFVNAWHRNAGKVAVGVDLHLPKYIGQSKVMTYAPSEYHSNPIAYLDPGLNPSNSEGHRRSVFAKQLLHRDIRVGLFYRPEMPLPHMLEAAANLDAQWHRVPLPMKWLLQNALHVPVHRKWNPKL
ncbi:uncharacterized protein LDX57_001677 [Aspergillus melleus]|uniref:uncharacterized protein n=1 Tax=Aspergillus melleus TaxID=138277 RepID=UPI001E8EA283|nr:uncharacterized protein LDX57_001677 [Aspergillus melleus]KAH8423920.1 hypothetical protein LDX57_001677 [Aspergillus melleus]